MTDVFSKKKRSQVMAAIKSKGNKDTELKLISIFRANGITGWRRNQKLPGKPDFVFHRERLVVFVDGCFWHGCRRHLRMPQNNRQYTIASLARVISERKVSKGLRQTLLTQARRLERLAEERLKHFPKDKDEAENIDE
jgi:DNA mismatch endonuclease (patch repair protein)